jgi:hypothetical protein
VTEVNGGTNNPPLALKAANNDIARCEGVGYEEDGVISWREGCEDCVRRTMQPSDP